MPINREKAKTEFNQNESIGLHKCHRECSTRGKWIDRMGTQDPSYHGSETRYITTCNRDWKIGK